MKKKSLLLTAVATLGLYTVTIAQNVPSYVPTNGLVGWWPFNGNANDESGNGNDGTVNGATLSADRFGGVSSAFSFSGNSILIPLNQQIVTMPSRTISLWFKSTQAQTGGRLFETTNYSWGIGCYNSTTFDCWYQKSNQAYNFVGESFQTHNAWHNLVFICDSVNQQKKVYLNGSLINSGIPVANPGNPNAWINHFLKIGLGNANEAFIGSIDDVGIWNRALTQQEITDLYNASNCSNNIAITPQTNSLITGSTATYTATTSDPNPSYIWQSDFGQGFQTLNNFGNYSGTNTSTLNIANVQLANHNQPIRVITTSGNCIDTSSVAFISIADTCITNVTVYDTLLTTVTDTLIINTQITGINPPNNSNTITVFPNPASTHITIDYGNFAIMNGYQLVIENSIGQQVFQTNITQQSDYLSLSTWGGNGLYFVHIIDPQGNTIDIRKIVLQ